MEKYLQPCLDWMLSKTEGDRESTRISLIQQCLPFLKSIDNKEEFAVAIIRGMGSGVQDIEVMREFCEYVRKYSKENIIINFKIIGPRSN